MITQKIHQYCFLCDIICTVLSITTFLCGLPKTQWKRYVSSQCTVHANTNFIVSALHRNKIISGSEAKKIAEQLCYLNTYKVACLLRSCKDCNDKQICYNEFDGDVNVTYYQWCKKREVFRDKFGHEKTVSHTMKLKKSGTAIVLVNVLEGIILKFMKHEAIILNQLSQLKKLRMKMDENEVIVHMDFSENYACKYESEIQSFHFGGSRQQISLHTTAVQFKETNTGPLRTKSFLMILLPLLLIYDLFLSI